MQYRSCFIPVDLNQENYGLLKFEFRENLREKKCDVDLGVLELKRQISRSNWCSKRALNPFF